MTPKSSSVKYCINIIRFLHLKSRHPHPFKDSWYVKTMHTGIERAKGCVVHRKTPVLFLIKHGQHLSGVADCVFCYMETEQSTVTVHVKWSKTVQCRKKILTISLPLPTEKILTISLPLTTEKILTISLPLPTEKIYSPYPCP